MAWMMLHNTPGESEVAMFTFYMVDCGPNRPKGKTPDTDQDPKPEEPKRTLTSQNLKKGRSTLIRGWMCCVTGASRFIPE